MSLHADDPLTAADFPRARRFDCSDGFCGADDCGRCRYWDAVEEEDDDNCATTMPLLSDDAPSGAGLFCVLCLTLALLCGAIWRLYWSAI